MPAHTGGIPYTPHTFPQSRRRFYTSEPQRRQLRALARYADTCPAERDGWAPHQILHVGSVGALAARGLCELRIVAREYMEARVTPAGREYLRLLDERLAERGIGPNVTELRALAS